MPHTLTIKVPVIAFEDREIDMEELCRPSEVGPESIIAVAVTTPQTGEWTRDVEVTITVREHPDMPITFYVLEHRGSNTGRAMLWATEDLNDQTVIEVGTETNPDLTVAHLFPVAEEIADLAFGGC